MFVEVFKCYGVIGMLATTSLFGLLVFLFCSGYVGMKRQN